ncbi:uncharacterized protein EKO05_0003144 [Ascochyta rabiei]|uniref:Uncharacterized protein n=1 Tax=Didymella rabiei TaxID=5454 RepID=A0A163BL69_DIDRA|nr:uncharacterized protein EKO05_0003144 [Ascochyta rabiei]KZM21833.1 hypothetical protein ST47_g7031 [Ascochyta rabiei]UPX12602.1 hypothetical protein EKO05_0003144 [Ascochyta rabiei]
MPPNKTASGEGGEGKFIWEGANENKLLLIILGRHIQTSEFEEVAQAFPGATGGAIRNRIGVLRAKQKKVYEELGWELPGGTTASAKKGKSTPSKRASDEDGEIETPSKKPRMVRKKKEVKSQTPEESDAKDEEEKVDYVKSEPDEV